MSNSCSLSCLRLPVTNYRSGSNKHEFIITSEWRRWKWTRFAWRVSVSHAVLKATTAFRTTTMLRTHTYLPSHTLSCYLLPCLEKHRTLSGLLLSFCRKGCWYEACWKDMKREIRSTPCYRMMGDGVNHEIGQESVSTAFAVRQHLKNLGY